METIVVIFIKVLMVGNPFSEVLVLEPACFFIDVVLFEQFAGETFY